MSKPSVDNVKKFIRWSFFTLVGSTILTPLMYGYAFYDSNILVGIAGGLFHYLSIRSYHMVSIFSEYLETLNDS